MLCQLEIPSIPVYMALGCTKEEQANPQKVEISLSFFLPSNISVLKSDLLSESINYVEVAELVEKIAKEKPYHMIEHLGHQIYLNLKSHFQQPLKVKVHKCQPPHPLLQNGCNFIYGDDS